MTAKLRYWNMVMLSLIVAGAMAGWLFMDKDPNQLMGIIGTLGFTTAALEGSNIGKRATFKKEAVEAGV